jgi:hypothetical protein
MAPITRTHRYLGAPDFVVDNRSIVRSNGGRQVDWDNVDDAYKEDDGLKKLPAGTIIGEELGNGLVSPRVDTTNPATGILESDAKEGDRGPDALTGYGIIRGGGIYENLLPDATGGPPKTIASAIKTELGERFYWETYEDDRA